jgi:hypothetical protein
MNAGTGVGRVGMTMPATRQEAQETPEAGDGHKDRGPNVHAAPGGNQAASCAFCGEPVGGSRRGGKPRRFCSPDHRIAFHAEARRVGGQVLQRRVRQARKEVQTIPRPKRCTAAQLRRVGVTLEVPPRPHLRCDRCGQRWVPIPSKSGRLPKGYWRCPAGCGPTAPRRPGTAA